MSSESEWLLSLEESFQDQENLYFVTEFLPGGTLSDLAYRADFDGSSEKDGDADVRTLPEDTVRFYAADVVMALEELHQHGFIHRDIKPENVMIGEDGHIKLVDFGSAVRLGPNQKVL